MLRFLLLTALLGISTGAFADLKTVPYVDPSRYLGTWYQIARNPVFFENGCVCSRQVLTAQTDGRIAVYNTCNNLTADGALREIRGFATNDDPTSNSRFTVDFGLPNKGKYWIIGVADDYQWAVVSEPNKQVLYILSKTPTMDPARYEEAVQAAATQVDTSKLELTSQNSCQYPPMLNFMGALSAPVDPSHPGSKVYSYGMETRRISCSGREVMAVLPTSTNPAETFPVVVYGHGQALSFEHYQATLEHLAKKGIVALHPTYDNGFFDQDWTRMGRDYANLTDCALKQIGTKANRDQIVFSGHSKGAYIASISAGLAVKENLPVRARSVVLFEAAGYDAATIGSIEPSTTLTVVFGDKDTVVERNLSDSIYNNAPSVKKQFITVKSYPSSTGQAIDADHYWPQTKGTFFGGGPEGALHYFGQWKWLVGAALDLKTGGGVSNTFIYGSETGNKGVGGLTDDVRRSW